MSETVSKSGSEAAPKKSWFKGLKSEFNKVMWADKKSVAKQTTAVVVITFVLGIIITLIDTVLQYGIDFLVKL